MLNRCEFIGNVGQDPEIRSTQDGKKVANISLGVSEKWKTASGESKEKTEWVRATIWSSNKGDGLAGVVEKYVYKGSKLYIAGRMETRKWQDKDGNDRYTTEIRVSDLELLDSANRNGGEQRASTPLPVDLDDEIPF